MGMCLNFLEHCHSTRETFMEGYYTPYGYMGKVNGNWMLFATEREYYEYLGG